MSQDSVRRHDLVDIARTLDAPYQPMPLERMHTVEVSAVVCGGAKTWHHPVEQGELLVVLEGIIAIDGTGGPHVADEGEVVTLPAGGLYRISSGMRSVALLLQGLEPLNEANGFHRSPEAPTPPLSHTNFAKGVHEAPYFDWLVTGEVRGQRASATRLVGRSEGYDVTESPLVVLNYRGVLDVRIDEEESDLIGGQLLVVPAGRRVELGSERGATLLVLASRSAALPQAASASEGGPGEPG